MLVNCTQCGAPLERGQRFCSECGAPVTAVPRPEQKPVMDLSEYFDEPADKKTPPRGQPPVKETYAPPARPSKAQPAPKAPAARETKSDRGLNIALLICSVLVIAVITFLVILLVSGRQNSRNSYESQDAVPTVTQTPNTIEIPGETPAAQEPVQIVTPSPQPTEIPAALPTAVPTIIPAPTLTPTPAPASDYLLPDSGTRYLTEADLAGLSHEQLCLARNEIFARHGRIFKTPQIAAYFSGKSWYNGTVSPENFNENVFNTYERTNIGFIRDYENKYYGGSYY